jgi:hypothetical protein
MEISKDVTIWVKNDEKLGSEKKENAKEKIREMKIKE